MRPRALQKRLVRLVATVWLIVTIAFFCAYRLPGDPARMILGQRATPESLRDFRQKMGLDQPLVLQYLKFVERVLRLDLGDSLVQRRPVASLIAERGGQTLMLISASLVALTLFGMAAPILLRLFRKPLVERLYSSWWIALAIAPPYVLSILALLAFAGWLRWVPVTFNPTLPRAWLLPAMVLAAYPVAVTLRLLNSQIEAALQSQYVRAARAYGYRDVDVLLRFAVPNAITPSVAAFANGLAFFVTGSFFVEVVFGIGGLGTLAYEAVRNKDVPVLVGLSIIFAVAICSISAGLQIVLESLDPRARRQHA